MKYAPHNYRSYATSFILNHPISAVLLEMGLGKSVISLTAINDLMLDYFDVSRTLVIAPLRVATAMTHKGTCTVFAQLFLILEEAIGLKVGCINSKLMEHRWNYVVIGDETYYLDTTFNASNPISNKLFFQTSPIHVEKALDQGIAVPHQE